MAAGLRLRAGTLPTLVAFEVPGTEQNRTLIGKY